MRVCRAAAWVPRRLAVAIAAAAAAVLCSLTVPEEANAQAGSPACRRMAAQISALGRAPPGNTARYARSAARQQRELARTAAYAASRGCNRQRFLFFGDPPPPQCGALNARIAQMRANLANLQGHVQNANAGRDAQRRALMARYDANCRERVAVAPQREPGLFERLFGGGQRDPRFDDPNVREMPIEPPQERDPDEERGPRGGSKAVCVRTCDGGFFPVSYSARRSNLGDLAEMCSALCPNAETKLYTYSPGREIDDSVSSDGEPYSSLPNAGKFKTSFNPTCTCKPAQQSWAQVLGKAEELLDNKSKRDLIVDAKKSAELSKPKVSTARKGKRSKQEMAAEQEAEKERRDLENLGKREAQEAQNIRAGIDPGKETRKRVYSLHDGKKAEVKDASGTTRTIRIIAPKL